MLGLSTVEQLMSLVKTVGNKAALAAELVELVPAKAIRGKLNCGSLRALGLSLQYVGTFHWEVCL